MSQRHKWAVSAVESHNLLDLAKLLTGSVQEALAEGQMPHMDPAVRLISFQISLVGNGDLPFRDLYERTFHYCEGKAREGPNYEYLEKQPEYQAN